MSGASTPLVVTSLFNFTPQAPGGTLTSGTQTINVSPGIPGVAGSSAQQIYASGGTGTPGVCTISGGTATSGVAGTLIINCASGTSLSGAWTFQSATSGASEALVSSGPTTGLFTPCGTWNIYGTVNWNGFSGSSWQGDGPCTIFNLRSAVGDLISWTAPINNINIGNFSVTSPSATRTGGWIMHGNCPNDSTGACILVHSRIHDIHSTQQYNGLWLAEYGDDYIDGFVQPNAVSGGRGIALKFGQTAPNSTSNQGSDVYVSNSRLYGDDSGAGALNQSYGVWIEDADAVHLNPGVDVGVTYQANVHFQAGSYGVHNHFILGLVADGGPNMDGADIRITGSGLANRIMIDSSWIASSGTSVSGSPPSGCSNNNSSGILVDVATMGELEIRGNKITANCGNGIRVNSAAPADYPLISGNSLANNGKGNVSGYQDGIYVNAPINAAAPFITGNVDSGCGSCSPGGHSLNTTSSSNAVVLGQNQFTPLGQSYGITPTTPSSTTVPVTLPNGPSQNVTTGISTSVRVTGPTAPFSIGGFIAGYNGQVLTVFNPTGQAMTITNADSGSLAANRITTVTGGDLVLGAVSSATFYYDTGPSLWILISSSGGGSTGGPHAITVSHAFTGTQSLAFTHSLNAVDGSSNPIVPANSCTDVTSGAQVSPSSIVPTSANVATITYTGLPSTLSCHFVY